MGTELSTMNALRERPPQNLEISSNMFLAKYAETLLTLSPLQGSALAAHYIMIANNKGTSPLSALLGDFSTLSTLAAQSGIQFEDTRGLGTLALGKTAIINGPSGTGKSNIIDYERGRLINTTAAFKSHFQQHLESKDQDGDSEMTPAPIFSHLNFDTVTSVNVAWDHLQYEQFFARWKRKAGNDDIPWVANADRMKCLYQKVIERLGWMTMHIQELDDKISSLSEQGEKMGGQFIIQASDKNLPPRSYSTRNLSTPGIRNCRVSILAACTPETLLELLQKHGLKGMMRRVLTAFFPNYSPCSIDNMIDTLYGADGALQELETAFDEALETHRDFEFFKFMMVNPLALEGGSYFKQEIEVVTIGLLSDLKQFQREYKRNHPNDPDLTYIEYPENWVDEEGNLLTTAFGIEDIYYQIKKDQMRYRSALDTVAQIMLKERHIRVFTLAWSLTVRKHLLRIENTETPFQWDLKLDVEMTRAALEFIKIFDEYTYMLMLIPISRNSSNNSICVSKGPSVTNNLSQKDNTTALAFSFRKKILEKIIQCANPSTTSSIVTRKLYGLSRFKNLDNLENIRSLVQVELEELFEIEPLALANNKKWAVSIKRKPLSVVTQHYSRVQKYNLYVKLVSFGMTVVEWSAAFGDVEMGWALANKKLGS